MKKYLVCLILMMFMMLPANAACPSAQCVDSYDLCSAGTRVLYNVTGTSTIARLVAQSIIKKEIKKATGAKFKVKLGTYSAKDLMEGRFKSLSITGKNLNIDGAYISYMNVETLCDFNYIQLDNDKIYFKENLIMGYAVRITSDDLSKTVLSSEYVKFFKALNLRAYGINLFELNKVDAKIKDNRVYFTLNVSNKIFNRSIPLNLTISNALQIQGGQIVLVDAKIENSRFRKIDVSMLAKVLNLINPFEYSLSIMDNNKAKLKVESIDIIGDKIMIEGTVIVPKNVTDKK